MKVCTMAKRLGLFVAGLAVVGLGACTSKPPLGELDVYDLSHATPFFGHKGKDDKHVTDADMSKPFKNSKPIASFGFQAVRVMKKPFTTEVGHYQWAWYWMDEHYGTHVDSTDHYQNKTLEVAKADNRSLEQYTVADLTGPIVLIDISDRVAKALAKNGGKPSPDRKVMSFRPGSKSGLTVADIDAVADQITDRSWIVVRTGWDKFFVGTPPKDPFMHPYINGLNYPGLDEATTRRLIEIEDAKGIRINGVAIDNLSIDAGYSGLGSKGNPFGDGWYAHQYGLQRGWKFVENAAGLGQIAGKKPGECSLLLGAPKMISGTGTPTRVLAVCNRP